MTVAINPPQEKTSLSPAISNVQGQSGTVSNNYDYKTGIITLSSDGSSIQIKAYQGIVNGLVEFLKLCMEKEKMRGAPIEETVHPD